MQILKIENLSKSYGEKILLDEIDLTISKGDRIGLVAKNGSGKSTLLRVIAGIEEAEGENRKVFLNKSIRLAVLWQEENFSPESTVLDVIFDLELPEIKAVKEYQYALLKDEESLLTPALEQMDELKAWNMEARIKEVLSKLKIDNLDQLVSTLSGGQIKRLALARLIIEDADFIILDEPTNHLDIEMIEWIEKYLQNPNLTLLMLTHDRYFLERVCNTILELDRGELHTYRGNYSEFLEKRSARLENESVVLSKTKKLFKKELDWIRRQPKARGTKAKSRVEKFSEIKSQASKKLDDEKMDISLKTARLGSKILEAHRICKSFDDKILIDDFSYKFKKRERVGIVGPNGSGKSTFLKVLTQEIRPSSGRIIKGDTVVFGHYKQEGIDFSDDKRMIDVIRDIAEYIPLEKGFKLTAEGLLEKFLFPRSQHRVFVSQLSGGERRRLLMLTVLMTNPNFLILDEPTNDLDIVTLNVLEDYLMSFPGCLVIVSHDRYFMDKLVDHLFVLDGKGNVKDYNGNYSEFRQLNKLSSKEEKKTPEKKPETTPAETPKVKKLSYLEKKEFSDIEPQIAKLEARKIEITKQFEQSELDPEGIKKLSLELTEIQQNIEVLEDRWLELSQWM